jgi:hypothetical protein
MTKECFAKISHLSDLAWPQIGITNDGRHHLMLKRAETMNLEITLKEIQEWQTITDQKNMALLEYLKQQGMGLRSAEKAINKAYYELIELDYLCAKKQD